MELLELYKTWNKDESFKEIYYSNAKNCKGQTYRIFSTNTRSFSYFESNFNMMKSIEDKPRVDWEKQKSGQFKMKQYPKYFETLLLFETEDKQIYKKTKKGDIQEEIFNATLSQSEKSFLTILNLLDSPFDDRESYLIDRTKEINQSIDMYINKNDFLNSLKHILKEKISFNNCVSEDAYWILTFFDRQDLLVLLYNSKNNHKRKLKKYVSDNYTSGGTDDVISKKFNNDNYKPDTVHDDMLIYYCIDNIIVNSTLDLKQNLNNVLPKLAFLDDFKKENIVAFINQHEEYFNDVYKNAFDAAKFVKGYIASRKEDAEDEEYLEEREFESTDEPEKKRTPITIAGRNIYPRNIKVRDEALKKADYKCEFEESHNTFRVSRKYGVVNYSEAHHLIPMSTQDDFKYSIDIVENVVSLCPTCHRRIHISNDKEVLLNALYEKRKDSLEKKGIKISFENLKKYY